MFSFESIQQYHSSLLNGSTSCTAVTEYYLNQIHQHANLNAFIHVFEEEALERAKLLDSQRSSGRAIGKLHGVVVALKDVLCYKDHPVSASSSILSKFTSIYTATAVERLLEEGAIIIGSTNCDEFAMGSSNENSAFGPVLNAADETRVSGGSSGGSAVAVQANLCRISLGSDTGGSVRQPAAFCGIVGLKPTYSRISRYGLIAYGSSFDCVGIFGKSVEDVALVLEVIAGPDEFDSTVSHQAVPPYASLCTEKMGKKYRVAYIREIDDSEALQPEIKASITRSLNQIKEAGHFVQVIDFPLQEYVLPTYYILATAEASSNLSRFDGVRYGHRTAGSDDLLQMYKKSRSEGFGKEVQTRILLGTFVLSASYYDAYYTKAQKVRRIIREKTKELLREFDFIVMPITPTTAFKLGEHRESPIEMYLADLFSVQANVAGVPAIVIPCGEDGDGLPIGLQIIADDFEESKLLHFSNALKNMN